MIKTILFAAIAFATIAGCATPDPAKEAAFRAAASRPVTCRDGSDCQQKWSRAIEWVRSNSAFGIMVASDYLIQTDGPNPPDPRLAYSVTRVSVGNGIYEFNFKGDCNRVNCYPSPIEAKAKFVTFVIGG